MRLSSPIVSVIALAGLALFVLFAAGAPSQAAHTKTKLTVEWTPEDQETAALITREVTKEAALDKAKEELAKILHVPPGMQKPTRPIAKAARIAKVGVRKTLSILNSPAVVAFETLSSLSECSTDTDNIVRWRWLGWSLLKEDDGVPRYKSRYPEYLIKTFGKTRPVERWCGTFTLFALAPQFYDIVMFDPKQAPDLNRWAVPLGAWGGLIWYGVYATQFYHSIPGLVTDFSTPEYESIAVEASSGGELELIEPQGRPDQACNGADSDGDGVVDDGCMVVTDVCGDGLDNDGDTETDELCGLPILSDPPPYSGLWSSNTHLFISESQSYRDLDNDGITNDEDSCPYVTNTFVNSQACWPCPTLGDCDADGLNEVCDPDDCTSSPTAPASCTVTVGLPDEDQDCFANRQDTCPLDSSKESGTQCDNATDDDEVPGYRDLYVNDGCPAVGDAEGNEDDEETWCYDALDNDGDTKVNDGCPAISSPDNDEWWCDNESDDDGDGRVNDGCPAIGEPESGSQCDNATDDDNDKTINDGCPEVGAGEKDKAVHDDGPPSDSIGAICDTNKSTADGDFVSAVEAAAVCIGSPDSDEDGWCDDIEVLLSSYEHNASSTPEVVWLPGTCYDREWYATPGDPIGPGPEIDNDGDGYANASDSGCDPAAGDTDQDGICDGAQSGRCVAGYDNCPGDWNAEQMDTDGDTVGDACDDDRDDDGFTDYAEFYVGTDHVDSCPDVVGTSGCPGPLCDGHDAWPPDLDVDRDADIVDVLVAFMYKILIPAAYDPRSDFDTDGDLDIVDVIAGYKNTIMTSCTP